VRSAIIGVGVHQAYELLHQKDILYGVILGIIGIASNDMSGAVIGSDMQK